MQFWTPYSYVGNRPLVGTDPSGMYWDYANMSDAELTMHENFTSTANADEMAMYDLVADDPTRLVSNHVGDLGSKSAVAAFAWPNSAPKQNSMNQDLLTIKFRSEALTKSQMCCSTK